MPVLATLERILRAGELRHVIGIQRATTTADGVGGTIEAWVTLTPTVRAAIEPLEGMSERAAGNRLEGVATHRIRIRVQGFRDTDGHETTIRLTDRVLLGTRVFQIRGVHTVLEENRVRVILAEEVIA